MDRVDARLVVERVADVLLVGRFTVVQQLHVRHRGILGHRVGDVDPEAVDTLVEPERQHVLELRTHLGMSPVEVGLAGREKV